MGRAPCCEKLGLKKGPWTPEEDQKLIAYIQKHGHGSWRALPQNAGLLRCGKSCRLRWTNYLRPDIKRGRFSSEEEQIIIQLHAILGNRWSAISTHLPGRTDNEIKNYWNTHLKKRLLQLGIDPVTHKPKSDLFESFVAKSHLPCTLNHMAQWETARLEAEARLSREYLRFSSCGQSPNVDGIPPTYLSSAWKKEAREDVRKEFSSSTVSSDRTFYDSFKKIPRECDQALQTHPFNVCHGIIEDRLCSSDLRFPSSHSLVSLHFDDSRTIHENSPNLCLKDVDILEQNIPSSSTCLLANATEHPPKMLRSGNDNPNQCESLLQQSEKLLQNKIAFCMKEKSLSTHIIKNSSDEVCESSAASTECSSFPFISPAFSDGITINTSPVFCSHGKQTKANTTALGTRSSTSDELISHDRSISTNFSDYNSFSSGLPTFSEDLPLDLPSLQKLGKTSACAISEDLTSFSDQPFSIQSKDYWCNVLRLVGSPVLG